MCSVATVVDIKLHSMNVVCGASAITPAPAAAGLDADVEVAQVEAAVKKFEEVTGRRPRILIAKMGQDGHDRCVRCQAAYDMQCFCRCLQTSGMTLTSSASVIRAL